MPLFAVAFAGSTTTNGTVVNGIQTTVNAFCDGKKISILTRAATVGEALAGSDCALEANDISNPPQDSKLEGESMDVGVIRAVPVTIIDNGKIRIVNSAYSDSTDILNQVGIKVYPEDRVSQELILSNFNKNGMGQEIIIQRAPHLKISVDGTVKDVRSWKKTVGEVLAEKYIALSPHDEVTPAPSANITSGMDITVTRVNESDEAEDQPIPYGTDTIKDLNMYQGQSKVQTEGANGVQRSIYHVIYKDGAVASKTLTSQTVVTPPQNKVVVEGEKPYNAGDLWGMMVEAGQKYGVDPGDMLHVMYCESGGRVNAVNGGGYKGLFQWDGSFHKWTAIAGVSDDYFNPRSQIFATAARVSATGGWRAWQCKP